MPARSQMAKVTMPLGGLDRLSGLSEMPADRAVVMTNMMPDRSTISVRNGYTTFAAGLGAPVETLIPWRGPEGTNKLFGAAGANVYDVTAGGAVGAAAISSMTNARWQFTHMATSGGQFVWMCNGADAERHYNGSTWATPTLTNLTAGTAIQVMTHQRRLFMVIKDTQKFGYLPVDSVAGTVAFFDLGPMFRSGGYLMACGSWTIDTGVGPDDFAVFISSEGEAVVYQGIDPSDADSWSVRGVYKVGRPIGRRCVTNFGGDLWIMTHDGLVSMSGVIQSADAQWEASGVVVSQNIRDLWSSDASSYGDAFGWQAIVWPEGRIAIVNVPEIQNTRQHQLVMNTLTGAWGGPFTGLPAACWGQVGGSLYFGGNDGKVYSALAADVHSDDGGAINWEMVTAFSGYGDPAMKHTKRVYLTVETDGTVTPAIGIDTDYRVAQPQQEFSYSAPSGIVTVGTSVIDGSDVIGGSVTPSSRWIGIGRTGHALALHIRGQSAGIVARVTAANLLYEQGGVL